MGLQVQAGIEITDVDGLDKIIKEIERDFAKAKTNVKLGIEKGSSKTVGNLTTKLNALSKSLDAVANSSASANKQMKDLLGSFASLNSENSKLKEIKVSAKEISNVGKVSKESATLVQQLGKELGVTTRRFGLFVIGSSALFGLLNAFKDASREAISFQKEIVRLRQVTGQSASGIQVFRRDIEGISRSLGISSKSLIDVTRVLAQAGLSIRETQVALRAIARTDLASTFDGLNNTVEGSIAILQQFKLQAEDLGEALDIVNTVSKAFAIEASDIIDAVRKGGGTFAASSGNVKEFGESFEGNIQTFKEFLALITAVRSTTRESISTIATGLRTVTARLQRIGTQQSVGEILGIDFLTDEGQFVGTTEAFRRISQSLKDLNIASTDPRFSRVIEEIAGVRQRRNVEPIINNFALVEEVLRKADESSGSVLRDSVIAQEAFALQLDKTRENFLSLVREISDTSSFRELANDVLLLTNAFIELLRAAKPLVPFIATFGTFKAVGTLVPFLQSAFQGFAQKRSVIGTSGAFFAKRNKGGSVPTLLTPGELVFGPKAVSQIGVDTLSEINKARDISVVPGMGSTDTFPTTLPSGSFVINKKNSQRLLGFNAGGLVPKRLQRGSNRPLQGGGVRTPSSGFIPPEVVQLVQFRENERISEDALAQERKKLEAIRKRLKPTNVGTINQIFEEILNSERAISDIANDLGVTKRTIKKARRGSRAASTRIGRAIDARLQSGRGDEVQEIANVRNRIRSQELAADPILQTSPFTSVTRPVPPPPRSRELTDEEIILLQTSPIGGADEIFGPPKPQFGPTGPNLGPFRSQFRQEFPISRGRKKARNRLRSRDNIARLLDEDLIQPSVISRPIGTTQQASAFGRFSSREGEFSSSFDLLEKDLLNARLTGKETAEELNSIKKQVRQEAISRISGVDSTPPRRKRFGISLPTPRLSSGGQLSPEQKAFRNQRLQLGLGGLAAGSFFLASQLEDSPTKVGVQTAGGAFTGAAAGAQFGPIGAALGAAAGGLLSFDQAMQDFNRSNALKQLERETENLEQAFKNLATFGGGAGVSQGIDRQILAQRQLDRVGDSSIAGRLFSQINLGNVLSPIAQRDSPVGKISLLGGGASEEAVSSSIRRRGVAQTFFDSFTDAGRDRISGDQIGERTDRFRNEVAILQQAGDQIRATLAQDGVGAQKLREQIAKGDKNLLAALGSQGLREGDISILSSIQDPGERLDKLIEFQKKTIDEALKASAAISTLNISLGQLEDVANRANTFGDVLRRAGDEFEFLSSKIQEQISGIGGARTLGKISGSSSFFENPGAFTQQELLNATRSTTAGRGSVAAGIGSSFLAFQDIAKQVQGLTLTGGDRNQQLESVRQLIGTQQTEIGKTFLDLLDTLAVEQPDLSAEDVVSEAFRQIQKDGETLSKTMQQLAQLNEQYQNEIRGVANELTNMRTSIGQAEAQILSRRAGNTNRLAQSFLGNSLNLRQQNAPLETELLALGGSTNALGLQSEQQRRSLLRDQAQIALANDPTVENAKKFAELNAQVENSKKALELLANDSTRAGNALSEIQRMQQERQQAARGTQSFLESDFASQQQQLQGLSKVLQLQGGQLPTTSADIRDTFAAIDQFAQFNPREAERLKSQLLGGLADRAGVGGVGVGPGGETIGQLLSPEGAAQEQELRNSLKYLADESVIAAQLLNEASKRIADTFAVEQITNVNQVLGRRTTELTETVGAGGNFGGVAESFNKLGEQIQTLADSNLKMDVNGQLTSQVQIVGGDDLGKLVAEQVVGQMEALIANRIQNTTNALLGNGGRDPVNAGNILGQVRVGGAGNRR